MNSQALRPARRLLLAVGIAAGLVAAPLSAPLAATAATSIDGAWQTDGYSTIVAIDNGKARVYVTAGMTCTPAEVAEQDGPAGPAPRPDHRSPAERWRLRPARPGPRLPTDKATVLRLLQASPERSAGPGGLHRAVSNEEFRTLGWQAFDGPGIPPDVRTPVFTPAELAGHRDSAFTAALTQLRSGG